MNDKTIPWYLICGSLIIMATVTALGHNLSYSYQPVIYICIIIGCLVMILPPAIKNLTTDNELAKKINE